MKLICPDCGRQYETGKFCSECGGKLQEVTPELVCPSCGYKAKSGKFCPECGTKLTEQIAKSDAATAPKSVDRTFNEEDSRSAKYYDKKDFTRTIPQEERANPEEVNRLAMMTVPSVELSNVRINKNIKEKGVLGFEVVLKMVANEMVGRKLNFSAYCVPENGDTRCLKKPGGGKYVNPATKEKISSPKECLYFKICKPSSSSTVWNSIKFFIPYADILSIQAKREETLVLIAWDQTKKKPELLACEEIPFSISYTTHMFRSNEWDFALLSPNSKKRLVTVPKKPNPLVTVTPNKKEIKHEITKLPMDEIRKAANASYPKESLKSLAVAALKIAEVIEKRLPDADVSYMVYPSEFDPSVNKAALPIHFLFKKDGNPVVAVVVVTSNGYNATHVIETADACENNGIGYVRVFADGYYADWIQGWKMKSLSKSPWFVKEPVSQETIDFCKEWLVDKISEYL